MHMIKIFGDSYIARLEDSKYADLRLPGPTVRYFEKGGLALEQVQHSVEWRRMIDWRPTHVSFHCGGNSFNSRTTPLELFKLTQRLICQLSPARVFIGESLHQRNSSSWFYKKVDRSHRLNSLRSVSPSTAF